MSFSKLTITNTLAVVLFSQPYISLKTLHVLTIIICDKYLRALGPAEHLISVSGP